MSKTSAATKAQYKLSTRKGELVLQAGQVNVHKAAAGEAYRVLKQLDGAAAEQLADDVVAQRSGVDLQLDYADGTRLTLQDYFTECKAGPGCALTLAADAPAGYELTAASPEGAKLADGASVLYAHGSPAALAGMVPSHQGLEQPLAGLKGDLLTYIPQDHSNAGWVAGGAGLAALLGGAGGGGSAAAAVVQNFVKLSFVGGPALSGNDLSVQVYRADGKTLISTTKLNADGSVTVDAKDYVGVVIVKLVNNGSAPDYLDEATGQGKDLSAQLYTMGVISEPNSTISLNVNVLTTIAYTKAQEAAGGTPGNPATLSAKQVTDTATAISKVFQVDDVLHTAAVATNSGAYNAADGLNAGEKYGAVLAAFSGADHLGSGSVQQTIDTVLAGITLNGDSAVIKNETQAVLVEGAKVAVPKPSTDDPSGGVSLIVDTYAPVFTSPGTASVNENIGAGRVVYTAQASDPSAFVYSLSGADGGAFTIDAKSGAVTLNANPDFETKPSYAFTVVATDTAGNRSEHAVTLTVKDLDEVAPDAPHVALTHDTGNSASDRITSDATLSVSGLEAGARVEYSTDGKAWSATFTPAEGLNKLQVRQVDAAGNAGAATALDFTLDTGAAAPTLVLSQDTGGSASDRITSKGALSLGGVEAGAQVEYSTDGKTWSSGFAPVEGVNTVQVRQIDAAGNVSGVTSLSFTLDTSVAAPTVALVQDTGNSASDRLTSNGALSIGGLEAGAQVEYSTDGKTWSSGFAPAEGVNTVEVRQIDLAGNVSGATSLSFTLATSVEAPTVALAQDTGSSASDGLTRNGAINVGAPGAGGSLQYSVDGGLSWSSGFSAVSGANNLQVRQVDAAGNVSDATALSFTLDDSAPVFTSSATATGVVNGSHNGSVIYTAAATDAHAFTYSLGTGADNAKFSINASTGAVTLNEAATGSGYNFTVIATDAAGNASSKAVSLGVTQPPLPVITQLLIETGTKKVGDVVTATITISDDGGVPLSGISGTIDGFTLGHLTRVNSTTYTATFTVTQGGQDVAMGDRVPFSFSLTDGFSRNTATYSQQAIVDDSVTEYAIQVHSTGNAADLVSIGFNVTHTYDADLVFTLQAPDGSRITLVNQKGGGGENFVNTLITTGGAALGSGSAPFTGSYAPEQAFSGLTGSAQGTWKLIIADTAGADIGFLQDWTIHLPDFDGSSNATAIDAHAPTLDLSTPLDNASNIATAANLTLTFSENIVAGSGQIKIVNDSDSSDTRTISITDSSQISISGKVLTINPSADLQAGAHYHLEIDGTALHDAAGNNYAGISNSSSLDFTVAAGMPTKLLVTGNGLFVDVNSDGSWDEGDTQLVRYDEGQWVYTAAATGATEQVAGAASAAISVDGIQDGAGHAIAFAGGEWSVTFLAVTGPKLNLTGFGADDKIIVDMSEATVSGNQIAMGKDLGVLQDGSWQGDLWGWDGEDLPADAWGKVSHYPYDYHAGAEEALLQVNLGNSITAHYEVNNRPGDNRSGDLTLAINLPTNYHYDFLLPAAD